MYFFKRVAVSEYVFLSPVCLSVDEVHAQTSNGQPVEHATFSFYIVKRVYLEYF